MKQASSRLVILLGGLIVAGTTVASVTPVQVQTEKRVSKSGIAMWVHKLPDGFEVKTGPRSVGYIKLKGFESWAHAEGRWRLTSTPDSNSHKLPFLNTVEIMCDPRKCEETMGLIFTSTDGIAFELAPGLFWVDSTEYEVLRYEPEVIVAVHRGKAADITLTLRPEFGTAQRVHQETGARGAEGATPKPWTWELE